jgi:D-aminopeptidase
VRLRELGLRIGELEAGATDSIADVAGIRVGHVTVWRDEPEPPEGRGVARTGVTAVVPPSLPLRAGVAVLNGAGELTGSHGIREWGQLDTPVYLTATMAVGRVFDGAVSVAVASDPSVGVDVLIPVAGSATTATERGAGRGSGRRRGRAVRGRHWLALRRGRRRAPGTCRLEGRNQG